LAVSLLAFLPRFRLRLMALILFTLPLVGLLTLFGTLLLRHRLRCGDLLGPRALCGLALARISERTHARVLLLLGELRQHHASTVRLSFLLRSLGKERLGRARRGFRLRFLNWLRGRPRAKRPALLLLDQDGFRPAMAKALAHMAGLHGAAHIKGHLAAASSFAFGLVRLTHSSFVSTSLGFLNAALPLR